jgi:hypothetical protein
MRHLQAQTSDQIVRYQSVTLLELIDRLLDKGVMLKGEILLSVADIDLVYLNLSLLLSSVKTVEEAAKRSSHNGARLVSNLEEPLDKPLPKAAVQPAFTQEEFLPAPQPEIEGAGLSSTSLAVENGQDRSGDKETITSIVSSAIDYGSKQILPPKAAIESKNVEKGLIKLVLTLVELIRKLMEKQAIRRIEAEQLNASEIERVGNAFFLLDEKMELLKKTFGLEDEDLNLDLGPLGELM